MTSYSSTRVYSTLKYMCVIFMILSITELFGIQLFKNNSLFAESVVTGNVTVCVKNDKQLFDEKTCKNRLHSNIDLSHGLNYYHYIFRRKDNPTKGLYVIVRTSNTSVKYRLDYKITVPYYYKEYTEGKTYSEVSSKPDVFCASAFNPKCTKGAQLPPGAEKIPTFCCICNANVFGPTHRASFKCDGKGKSIAMSFSCLEVIEPWYNLYAMSYPPDVLRNSIFSVYKFDNSKGIMPDLDIHKEGYYDNFDFKKMKKLDPSFQSEQKKKVKGEGAEPFVKMGPAEPSMELTRAEKTESFAERSPENKIVDNYRNIMIDDNNKEVVIDDLDISITYLSSNTKNGSVPPMMDKYLAIPSFPRTNETVKGSSLLDKCMDDTWKKPFKCPDYMPDRICNLWRCTVNMRTVDKDAVDTTGNTCDKIGYSMKSHEDHRKLCSAKSGTCINRQLKWYLDQKGEQAKLQNLYGVEPALSVEKTGVPRTEDPLKVRTTWLQEDRQHFINYVHDQDDTSRYKIDTFDATITEIVSEFPGFILSTKIDKECKVNSTETCTLRVNVKNMGVDAANFTVKSACYLDETSKSEENTIAKLDEMSLNIKGNGSRYFTIPIKLVGGVSSDKSYCEINLLSGTRKHLDTFKAEIKVTDSKPFYGTDPKHLDPDVFVAPKNIKPAEEPAGPKKDGDRKGKDVRNNDKNATECTCAKWNVFCMLINFRKCVVSKLNKVFMYFMIALGILLFLILLPVIIPLLESLGRGFIKLCKMPHEAMERRRIERMSRTVTNVKPSDFNQGKYDIDLNSTKLTKGSNIYPEVNVNLNLNDPKRLSNADQPSYDPMTNSVDDQSVMNDSISSIRGRPSKVNNTFDEI